MQSIVLGATHGAQYNAQPGLDHWEVVDPPEHSVSLGLGDSSLSGGVIGQQVSARIAVNPMRWKGLCVFDLVQVGLDSADLYADVFGVHQPASFRPQI